MLDVDDNMFVQQAGVAQSVARNIGSVEVTGSIPVASSNSKRIRDADPFFYAQIVFR